MMILSTLLALLVFPLEGMLALRLVMKKKSILSLLEHIAYGFLLGGALSAFLLFWAMLFGLPLTFVGFAIGHFVLILLLLIFSFMRFGIKDIFPRSTFLSFILAWLIVWTAVKIVAGGYDLFVTPAFYNDIHANWNMRAKVFYTNESLLLNRPVSDEFFFGGRVPSYPLTVYFAKVWIAQAVGSWHEGAVDSIHLLWFFSLLAIFFVALRRELGQMWAVIGTFTIVSIPLLLIHGVNAYTDVLMAAHLFAVLYAFYRWMITEDQSERSEWLKIFAVMTAAMLFVKNEALLIFLPPIALLFFIALLPWKKRTTGRAGFFSTLSLRIAAALQNRDLWLWVGCVSLVLLPWTLFKITHGLTFGNATEVSRLTLTPNPEVIRAVEGDLLYTGSYLLFFPLFLLLLAIGLRPLRSKAVTLLTCFFLIVLVGEFCIYWLTPLSVEAIQHTGFGRGMIHILPIGVFVSTVILARLFASDTAHISRGEKKS